MKRTITLLVCLCLFFGLCACGIPRADSLADPAAARKNAGLYASERMGAGSPVVLSGGGSMPVSLAMSTVSSTGAELEYPRDRDYFDEPFTAYVNSKGGKSIYLMPKAQKGNGNLGTVGDGECVTILAQRNGYYFFETSDGRQGWNGKKFFSLAETKKTSADSSSAKTGSAKSSSDNKAELELPRSRDYYKEPFTAYVNASRGQGIYLMPMPEQGHGNLGTVKHGKAVTILAQRNGYYFFETSDGRQGWNGKKYFSVAESSQSGSGNASSNTGSATAAARSQGTGVGGYYGDGEYFYVLVFGDRLDCDDLTLYFFGDPRTPWDWYGEKIESTVVSFGPSGPGTEDSWRTGWFEFLEATNDDRLWLSYCPFDGNDYEMVEMKDDWNIRFADNLVLDISPKCKWTDHSYDYNGPGAVSKDFAVQWSKERPWCYEIDAVIKNGKIVEIAIPYYP